MGKRSDMERNPRDLYRTFDKRAGAALLPHLAPETRFCEPCAGHGDLIDQLQNAGHGCEYAMDIEPQRGDIGQGDMFSITADEIAHCDMIIANFPWAIPIYHKALDHFVPMKPMWNLIYEGWIFRKGTRKWLPNMKYIQPIGRLKWMDGTTMDGKDGCVWVYSEPEWDHGPKLLGRI